MSLDQRFADAMGALLGPEFPADIALAVSGGGDSMAMLGLAHNWARVWGVGLHVVTVDHGLRDGSAAEAAMVARECATLGHSHATLRWHWDGTGNLQDAARRGRLAVIDRWRAGLDHVLMAHTRDDLAETFLMRLARGSGVEGLSAMEGAQYVTPHSNGRAAMKARDVCWSAPPPLPVRRIAGMRAFSSGFHLLRPCLEMTRAELRHYLSVLKMPWAEDPSNDDPRFDRVRLRQARETLENLGLDMPTLAGTAARMRRARAALKARAVSVYDDIRGRDLTGCVTLQRAGFEATERDTQLRLLAAALQWISRAPYRPRADALDDLTNRLLGGGTGTLSGVKAETSGDEIILFREYAAVADLRAAAGLWDDRWQVRGTGSVGLEMRALGEALTGFPDWRDTGQPRAALMASPSVWRGETLIAAPLAAPHPDLRAEIDIDFTSFLLSH